MTFDSYVPVDDYDAEHPAFEVICTRCGWTTEDFSRATTQYPTACPKCNGSVDPRWHLA